MLSLSKSSDSKILDSILKEARIEKKSIEFATQDAMNKYLKDHPDADRKNHSVKQEQKPSDEHKKVQPSMFEKLKEKVKTKLFQMPKEKFDELSHEEKVKYVQKNPQSEVAKNAPLHIINPKKHIEIHTKIQKLPSEEQSKLSGAMTNFLSSQKFIDVAKEKGENKSPSFLAQHEQFKKRKNDLLKKIDLNPNDPDVKRYFTFK